MRVAKFWHAFVQLQRILFTKVSLCLEINGTQTTTFQSSVKLFSNKMHKATFKLVLTQRQYVDRSYWVVATNHWRKWVIFKRWKAFVFSKTCCRCPESHVLIHLWVDPPSHNSPIFVMASCVVPCQRPLQNPLWSNLSVCVRDSQPHPGCWWYRAQTRPTESHRTSDFGNHADSHQVCYLRLNVCWCYWLIYALGFCSIRMWATPVYN